MHHVDVLTISDFRLPGGTSHSTAEELIVQKRMGLRTALAQSHSRLVARPRPWAPPILRQLAQDSVEPLLPGVALSADLALLRHPIAVESMPDLSRDVQVRQAFIIANQPALRPDGSPEYDPPTITETVRARLGVDPVWAPIGPVVRRSLAGSGDQVRLLPYDWTNIFAQSSSPIPRRSFRRDRPRIGRHSRPQSAKWPNTAHEILAAYPASDQFDVRILGGATPAAEVLGKLPESWDVKPFAATDPSVFLADIDFWVYFHHPEWSEAYGRAIMEALWSGAVVILPDYLRITYGEAAVYAEPAQVTQVIDEYRSGARDYLEQSRAGQMFAASHAPEVHVERLTALLGLGDRQRWALDEATPSPGHPVTLAPPDRPLSISRVSPHNRFDTDLRPRALFITSNGAGMGHLTRMLGLARSAAHQFSPIFFSMSQGLRVVAKAGFPYEYVPFSSTLQTKSELWHAYLEDRLLTAIDAYDAEIVLFDGTWPYRGMLAALDQRDVMRVWVRRAMWKPAITPEQLVNAPAFDLVVEPGEHAHAYDQGATTTVADAVRVPPMTVLSPSEVLGREDALRELGLPTEGDQRYALVTLGAGNINDVASTQSEVLSTIAEHGGWQTILTHAPIAAHMRVASTPTLSTFPLARYTRAFDFAVSATGYNSFAEWMSGCLPTVWIPNLSTMTDDQDARARWAADGGYGVRALEGDPTGIREALEQMFDASARGRMKELLDTLPTANGADVAANLVGSTWRAFQQGRGVVA